ncbi:ABC transporter ATP-binding protein [Litorilinea aerophila]|uniref:ABC transporter ATP-binding protein n=1 Tax=Litorilinea aerophila TaxID=1204385 RepID=A0A540VFE3_9CHLR|nr:ABC transporter ATP-binding protein [Litorilinea aerophila]MCC9076761.1 ABC transporter ATP-binding protein [Litorilinea aerophila]GIV76493.1 MAG: ABC transporter [Litorilinea sp.]
MSDVLVEVTHVSKKFCRSLKRSLWYGVQDLGLELTGRSYPRDQLRKDEFWAVRDVSLQVRRGETLGLIGHNGAGKTTLLRMLNGLIKPDLGEITVRGRMQALIALGAGFNPVLTGRENIYINASVLGLSKAEIDRRFDEIVAFSGIEEFIDMPVQSYSSGMTVRLGFSVAAHLEPDVLLVDEVLAVGDLAFRTKCQVRIQQMKNNGVAIVLVSHNLHTISHVCTRAVTFEKGRIIYEGDTEAAIDAYRASLLKHYDGPAEDLRGGTGEIRVQRLEVLNEAGQPQQEFDMGSGVRLRLHYEASEPVHNPVINIAMHVLNSHQVTGFRTDVDGLSVGTLQGKGHVDIVVPQLNLFPNVYTLDAILFHPDGFTFYDRVNNAAHIKVRGGLQVNGTAYLPHRWQVNGAAPEAQATTDGAGRALATQLQLS